MFSLFRRNRTAPAVTPFAFRPHEVFSGYARQIRREALAESTRSAPVVGRLAPWPVNPNWMEFDTGDIYGIARVSDDSQRIDVLVMGAAIPGRGDGGRFIDALQCEYSAVFGWEIHSQIVRRMLAKRGFVATSERFAHCDPLYRGKPRPARIIHGMKWERSK